MATNLFVGAFILLTLVFTYIEPAQTIQWNVTFTPAAITLHMDENAQVLLEITNAYDVPNNCSIQLRSEQPQLAQTQQQILCSAIDKQTASLRSNVTVEGIFLGKTRISVQLVTADGVVVISNKSLEVTVVRRLRFIDHLFTGCVALLMSLLYINFGAALDLEVLRNLILRPIGPIIAFVMQFIGMPLLSYGLGLAIFPGAVEMQLGLFFTGVSPSGGASNIWSVILGGNINLSVLMTAISNLSAFFMMPLWLFTLGQTIFERGNLKVPYTNIATYAVALIIPICIGLAIQRYLPRVTRILVRLLKPISSLLILFIVIFAIVTNLYLFKLFSWQIIVAGLALPWLAYIIAWIVAKCCHQNPVDALTIAIETGIQNTGIAIFLLRFSLPQPEDDLTTVIPVAVAIMTPLPLLVLYIYKRCITRTVHRDNIDADDREQIKPNEAYASST